MKSFGILFLAITGLSTTYYFSFLSIHRIKNKISTEVSHEKTAKIFTQNGSDYKIEEVSSAESDLNDLVVYKKESNNWTKILATGLDSSQSWSLEDWNKDGLPDVITNWYSSSYVYLFDSISNEYVNTGKIGNVKSIEGNIEYDYERFSPLWMSSLFRIEDLKKQTFATMTVQVDRHKRIEAILIYKGEEIEEKLIETITSTADKPVDFDCFDYDVYWQKNWKRFVDKE